MPTVEAKSEFIEIVVEMPVPVAASVTADQPPLEQRGDHVDVLGRRGYPLDTKRLPVAPHCSAPDGSDVRLLLGLNGGDMAHFELSPGRVTQAVTHKTVEEISLFS